MGFWASVRSAFGMAPAIRALPADVGTNASEIVVQQGPGIITGKAAPSKGKAVARAMPDQSIWQTFQRVGGGVTPTMLSSIMREADIGNTKRLVDVANEYKQKDCHLQSVLLTAEESIAGLDWAMVLPENAKRRDRKAAEWVEKVVRSAAGLESMLAHQAAARFYPFSVSEILYAKDGGKLVPASFVSHLHRRFEFRLEDSRLVWKDDMMPDGIDFREAFPGKFIVTQMRTTGDAPQREGLIRVLLWAALFRNWDMSDWLKLGEIAWKPWRLGKYERNASQQDIDNLVEVLEKITTAGVATYSDTTTVDVHWLPNGSGKSSHRDLFEVLAAEMSKVVLGQTLTTEAGRIGTQALGSVQNEVRKDLRQATALRVFADLTRDLVAPLIRMNFGPQVMIPAMTPLTDDAEDVEKLAGAIAKLAGVGTRFPSAWVRDKIGAPEPGEGEETIGGQVQASGQQQNPPGQQAPADNSSGNSAA